MQWKNAQKCKLWSKGGVQNQCSVWWIQRSFWWPPNSLFAKELYSYHFNLIVSLNGNKEFFYLRFKFFIIHVFGSSTTWFLHWNLHYYIGHTFFFIHNNSNNALVMLYPGTLFWKSKRGSTSIFKCMAYKKINAFQFYFLPFQQCLIENI